MNNWGLEKVSYKAIVISIGGGHFSIKIHSGTPKLVSQSFILSDLSCNEDRRRRGENPDLRWLGEWHRRRRRQRHERLSPRARNGWVEYLVRSPRFQFSGQQVRRNERKRTAPLPRAIYGGDFTSEGGRCDAAARRNESVDIILNRRFAFLQMFLRSKSSK